MRSLQQRFQTLFLCLFMQALLLTLSSGAQAQSPFIADFFARNMSLVKGESTAIYWYSSNAAYARVFGFGKELNPLERRLNGGMTVVPEFSTTYELRLYNQQNEQVGYKFFTIIVSDSEPAVEVKRFNASTTYARAGQAVDLNYEVTGFKELSIIDQVTGQEYKHLNFCCSLTVYPKKSTVYTLRIVDRADGVSQYYQSVDIKAEDVPAPPTVASFLASSSQVLPGEAVTLSWQATGAVAGVKIQDQSQGYLFENLPASGQLTVYPQQSTSYMLQVTGKGGQLVTTPVSVRVVAPPLAPRIEYFRSSKENIYSGEPILLSWKLLDAVSSVVVIEQLTGRVYSQLPAQGQLSLAPTQTTLLTLQAIGVNGAVAAADVLIQVGQPRLATIEYLNASRYEVNPGEAVSLFWRTRDALDAALVTNGNYQSANFDIPVQEGSIVVYPSQTSTYNLKVLSPNGEVIDRDVTILVRNVQSPPSLPATCTASATASASGGSASSSATSQCSGGRASASASATSRGGSASAQASTWLRW